jgi:pimeloyl-ACP methyl ester carboxylesterase
VPVSAVHRIAMSDGISLAVRDEGDGTPVVLLHGFPDTSHVWRNQIPTLVRAGFRVVAPDLRGAGESDRPQDVTAYRITTLAGDVVAILDALGIERARLVGHDWGAGLSWVVAGLHADRVERLVAMSVGHPNTQRDPPVE